MHRFVGLLCVLTSLAAASAACGQEEKKGDAEQAALKAAQAKLEQLRDQLAAREKELRVQAEQREEQLRAAKKAMQVELEAREQKLRALAERLKGVQDRFVEPPARKKLELPPLGPQKRPGFPPGRPEGPDDKPGFEGEHPKPGPEPRLERLRQTDPEEFRFVQTDQMLEKETHALAEQFRRSEGETREKLRKQIAEAVGKHFTWRQERREREVKRIEEQLERLRQAVKARAEKREELIQRRVAELLGEREEVGF